jgi:hypothetical protein
MRRIVLLVLTVVGFGAGTASATTPTPQMLVAVSARGGLCPTHICHWGGRITATTISADGHRARRLRSAERSALTRAMAQLKVASLPKFTGTCPVAYDGQERIYRFAGKRVLGSCSYDLRHVKAVQIVDRLIAGLPAR